MNLFDEWFEQEYFPDEFFSDEVRRMRHAYEAGYNQRSSEVSEDLRIFNNLMSYVDTEH